MIKSNTLREVLEKGLNEGVHLIFICDHSGQILSKVGDEASTIIDVLSSIWGEYSAVGEDVFKETNMKFIIVENEDSYILASNLYGYIVGMKASNTLNLGELKINLESIAKYFNEQFSEFRHIISEKSE